MTEQTPEALMAFLNARLDEKEATAKAAGGERWSVGGDADDAVVPADRGGNSWIAVGPWDGGMDRADAAHIALNDPASALADVAADRALLAAYKRAVAVARFPDHEGGYADGLEDAIRIRAARFAGHPEYRAEEWRP